MGSAGDSASVHGPSIPFAPSPQRFRPVEMQLSVFDRPLDPTERLPRILARIDRLFDRVYSSRFNPLYQSGTLIVGTLLVMIVTGLYLLIFYQTSAPWESVAAMDDTVWGGRWIRSLHRYAADLAVVATAVHALRMALQGKTWGPRLMAWLSGVALLGLLLLSGWTGMVLVWDLQGQLVAVEGAKLLDLLPIFSEPIGRSFVASHEVGAPFFFLNLFVHIALPLVMALVLWMHTSRLARPRMLPPRGLWWSTVGILFALSVAMPSPLLAPADLTRVVGEIPVDGFYAFWLPASRHLSPAGHAAVWIVATAFVLSAPAWWRPRKEIRKSPSWADPGLCTGCTQCYLDCPYEAISMIRRREGEGSELVANVSPDLCVSCGICAGSCAPMGVGPPGRTGRDQLRDIRAFVEETPPAPDEVVVFSCRNGLDRSVSGDGAHVCTVHCAGAVHSSVVELLVRRGFGGVLVLACPGRSCLFREGPKWLVERLFHDREAELKERVDKRRVRVGHFGPADAPEARAVIEAFRREVAPEAARAAREERVEIDTECEVPDVEEVPVG